MSIDEREQRKDVITLAKGAGVSFVGSVAGAVGGFAFTLIAARGLGSHQFGVLTLGITIAELLGLLAVLGLRRGVIRYVAQYRGAGDPARERGTVLLASLLIGVAATVAGASLFVFADRIGSYFPDQTQLGSLLRLLAVSVPLSALTIGFVGVTDGQKKMHYRVLVSNVVQPALLIGIAAVLLLLGWQLRGVAVAYVVAAAMAAGLAFFFVHPYFVGPRERRIAPAFEPRQLVSFSFPLFLLNIVNQLSGRLEIYLLGLLQASEAAGIFNVVSRTALLGKMAQGSLISIFAPMIADLHSRGQKKEMEHLLQVATQWAVASNIPVLMLTILFAQPILTLFGSAFEAGATALIILAFAQFISVAVGPVGVTLTMAGWPAINLANSLATLILNLGLDLWFIPRLGLVGAALGSGVALSAVNLAQAAEVYHMVGVRSVSRRLVKPLIAGAGAAAGVQILRGFSPAAAGGLAILLVGIPLFLLLYAAALYGLGLEEEDHLVIRAVRKQIVGTYQGFMMKARPERAS